MADKIARAKSNIIATPEQLRDAFGGYIGSDYSRMGTNYPYLIILQSDKTLENFVDGGKITTEQYGKLFVRSSNKNHSKDLLDEVSGTVVKEQKGAELWIENKQVFYSNHFVSADMKLDLAGQHNCKPEEVRNVIKLLIKLDEPITLYNEEVYEFVVITVKGDSFMPYNEEVKEKQQEIFLESEQFRSMGIRNVASVPVSFWNITFGSRLKTKDKRKYYVFTFRVRENKSEVAFSLADAVKEASNFDLISMRPINVKFEEEPEEGVIDNTVEAEEVLNTKPEVKAEPINPDDLPF